MIKKMQLNYKQKEFINIIRQSEYIQSYYTYHTSYDFCDKIINYEKIIKLTAKYFKDNYENVLTFDINHKTYKDLNKINCWYNEHTLKFEIDIRYTNLNNKYIINYLNFDNFKDFKNFIYEIINNLDYSKSDIQTIKCFK